MRTESVADKKPSPADLCKARQQIAELRTLLRHIVEPDYTSDYWPRLDGRLNGKLLHLAEHLLVLLDYHYPSPPAEPEGNGDCPENCQLYQHFDYHD